MQFKFTWRVATIKTTIIRLRLQLSLLISILCEFVGFIASEYHYLIEYLDTTKSKEVIWNILQFGTTSMGTTEPTKCSGVNTLTSLSAHHHLRSCEDQ